MMTGSLVCTCTAEQAGARATTPPEVYQDRQLRSLSWWWARTCWKVWRALSGWRPAVADWQSACECARVYLAARGRLCKRRKLLYSARRITTTPNYDAEYEQRPPNTALDSRINLEWREEDS